MSDVVAFFQAGSPWSWLAALGVAIAASILIRYVLKIVLAKLLKLADRSDLLWDNLIVESLQSTKIWAIFAACLIPLVNLLSHNEKAHKAAYAFVTIMLALQVIIWGVTGINYWRKHFLQKKVATDASSAEALGLVATILQALFIVIVILIALSNLGVNISALIAGLGIGGIAIALAAQNVLGDLLGSLSIVLDKPFIIGDSIVMGNESGTVEDIGLKTTRLRATSGELLIVSNKDLLESRIHNYQKLYRRRIEKKLLISHDTPVEKLKEIPNWISEFIKAEPKLTLDRCALEDITDFSYVFTYVCYVEDPSYALLVELQQKLLLSIITKLDSEGVNLATANLKVPKVVKQ